MLRPRTLLDELLRPAFRGAASSDELFFENKARSEAESRQAIAAHCYKKCFFQFSRATSIKAEQRQGGNCAGCNNPMGKLEMHHLVPVQSADPKRSEHHFMWTLDNGVLLCKKCHLEKGHHRNTRQGAIIDPRHYREYFPNVFGKGKIYTPPYRAWLERATKNFHQVFPR